MRLLLLVSMFIVLPAQADGICKSTDAAGVTSFAVCTGDEQEQQVKIKKPQASLEKQPAAPVEQRILDVMTEDREKRKQVRDQIKQEAAELKRACAEDKDKLRSYQSAPYLYELDKDGNRLPIQKETQAQAIADLQADIKKKCR